jgi:hypothetical protein
MVAGTPPTFTAVTTVAMCYSQISAIDSPGGEAAVKAVAGPAAADSAMNVRGVEPRSVAVNVDPAVTSPVKIPHTPKTGCIVGIPIHAKNACRSPPIPLSESPAGEMQIGPADGFVADHELAVAIYLALPLLLKLEEDPMP